jgi:putative hemolysin
MLATEVALVLLLIMLNGVLAGSEMAIVSSRPARLESMARAGRRGAVAAQALQADPGRFLSTIQIGITLVGVLSGAISGATLGRRLAGVLQAAGLSAETASLLGVAGVVVAITYLSLVVGELAPKQLALLNPEGFAVRVAPALRALSRIAAAPVWLLDTSTGLVVRLVGGTPGGGEQITEEEIRVVLGEADQAGVFDPGERTMIDRLLLLGDRQVRAVFTPRVDVEVVDLSRPVPDLVAQIRASPYSRFPAHDGDRDQMVGVLDTKRLIGLPPPSTRGELLAALVEPPEVAESAVARDALVALQASPVHMALVYDEHGGFEGIVTATDILEAIVGEFVDEDGRPQPLIEPEDGGWVVRGTAHAADVAEVAGLTLTAPQAKGTIGGVVLGVLGRIPEVGDTVELPGATAEVTAMDGRRIGFLRLRPAVPAEAGDGDVAR